MNAQKERARMAQYLIVLMNCVSTADEKDAARLEIIELLREGL